MFAVCPPELIGALREQVKELQPQQWQGQGSQPSSSLQSPGDLDLPADSDDSDDDDQVRAVPARVKGGWAGRGGTAGGGAVKTGVKTFIYDASRDVAYPLAPGTCLCVNHLQCRRERPPRSESKSARTRRDTTAVAPSISHTPGGGIYIFFENLNPPGGRGGTKSWSHGGDFFLCEKSSRENQVLEYALSELSGGGGA